MVLLTLTCSYDNGVPTGVGVALLQRPKVEWKRVLLDP